jgi:acyl-CoA dehydrogenase
VRDAHLGSIWEGTSNIVALDALRAIRREQALDALLAAFPGDRWLAKAAAFASQADEADARQAATALYYATAAAILSHEGERLPRRQTLAAMVRAHRLEPRDPYEKTPAAFDALLDA